MNSLFEKLLLAFESHSPDGIRRVIAEGLDVGMAVDGIKPVNALIEMYFRSDRFPECLRLLLENGAELDDPAIAPVLLNDGEALRKAIRDKPELLNHRTVLTSTFTPLVGASLLHVASEYGNLEAARVLIAAGADVEARASFDEFGMNGHTPIFHTVNSNGNRSASVMRLLIDAGARCDVRLSGITWGRGFDWETTCIDVTPISYAQLGLLPQMQRKESDVYANVRTLLAAAGRTIPAFGNVPNRYLQPTN